MTSSNKIAIVKSPSRSNLINQSLDLATLLQRYVHVRKTWADLSWDAIRAHEDCCRPPKYQWSRQNVERAFADFQKELHDLAEQTAHLRRLASEQDVSEYIAITIAATNTRPETPEIFVPRLVAHILSKNPIVLQLASACWKIEETQKFPLTIAEFLFKLEEERQYWQRLDAGFHPDKIAEYRDRWFAAVDKRAKADERFRFRCEAQRVADDKRAKEYLEQGLQAPRLIPPLRYGRDEFDNPLPQTYEAYLQHKHEQKLYLEAINADKDRYAAGDREAP